jgi:Uma2 family endonuclease
MTTEELLALPDDGMDRWLIKGQLREKLKSVHNRWHSRTMARLGQLLSHWLDQQPEPRGEIYGGEVGCRLRQTPDSTVGIDLAYVSAELAGLDPTTTTLIDGPPILAVEILSPNDTQVEIDERIDEFLDAGVRLVWIIDAHDQTVLVYRPGTEPEMFNARQELSGGAELPGFRVPVAQIFTR